MSEITARLQALRLRAGMNIRDVERFFRIPWATAYVWCHEQHSPKEHTIGLIQERLEWLEDALKDRSLPVPLGTSTSERKALVERLRDRYEQRARSAT